VKPEKKKKFRLEPNNARTEHEHMPGAQRNTNRQIYRQERSKLHYPHETVQFLAVRRTNWHELNHAQPVRLY
jgi:hypothetical protein